MFYGYIDLRNDTNEPFYVGIGNKIRLGQTRRNKWHTRIVKKHGFTRVIGMQSKNRSDVEKWELETIASLRRSYTLTNMTDGGEKNEGYKMTAADIEKCTRRGSDHHAYGKPSPKRGSKHTHETKIKMRRAVAARNEKRRLEKLAA